MEFGIEITGLEKTALQEKIALIINPERLDPAAFFQKKLQRISKEEIISFFQEAGYCHFYVERYRGTIFKMYFAAKQPLINILETYLSPEEGEGLDLTIMPDDFSQAFMTSHDGDTFSVVGGI